jgi:hypothetical protein
MLGARRTFPTGSIEAWEWEAARHLRRQSNLLESVALKLKREDLSQATERDNISEIWELHWLNESRV